MIAELIIRCFHARTAAHILHLGTRSYAAHKALNEFYDEIIGLADAVAETYQGQYGLIEFKALRYLGTPSDGQALVTELASWVADNRHNFCRSDDTHLQNLVDEIVALCHSTAYKLKFLK